MIDNYTMLYDGLDNEPIDLTQTIIIAYLIRQVKAQHTYFPKVQQTQLARKAKASIRTISRKIVELKEMDYLDFKGVICKDKENTTQFILKDKILKYIDKSKAKNEETNSNDLNFDLTIETATDKQTEIEKKVREFPSVEISSTTEIESQIIEPKETNSIAYMENYNTDIETPITSPKPSIKTMLEDLENKDNLDLNLEIESDPNKAINPTSTASNEEKESETQQTDIEGNTIDFAAIQATKINYYDNATDNNNSNIKNLLDAVQESESNKEKYEKIKYLQGSLSLMSKERKQEYKRTNIPLISVSVQFYPKAQTRSKANIKHYTNIIALDIDQKENNLPMETIKEMVKQFPFVFYLAQSVSGKGLFALVYIDGTIEDFQPHYFSLEKYFLERGIIIDKMCKDATRLRYCTIDKHYYINPNAVIYKGKEYQTNSNEIINKKNFNTKQTFSQLHTIYNCENDIENGQNMAESEEEKKLKKVLKWCKESNIIINPSHKETLLISKALSNDLGLHGFYYLKEFAAIKHGENLDCAKYEALYLNDLKTKTNLHIPTIFQLYKDAKGMEKIDWNLE